MATTKLTAPAIERLKPPAKGQAEYFDRTLPGFGLRVSYAGSKTFFVMTRVRGSGRLVRVTLGRHPAMSLAEARAKAGETIHLAEKGQDPRSIRVEEERQRDEDRRSTFDGRVAEFLERYVDQRLRTSTAGEYRRVLNGSDFAEWRGRPINEISRRDAREVIDDIGARGKPGAANLTFAYLRKFFNWCVEREIIEASPLARMKAPFALQSRDRVLTDPEIALVMRAFDAEGGHFRPALWLLLLTGQRRSEITNLIWEEISGLDGDQPAIELVRSRTKNAHPHRIPLARQAVDILRNQLRTSDLVFTTTGSTPLSGFSRVKARLDAWMAVEREAINLPPLPPWTLHDLRRTMVTLMNERLGIPPHIVEAVVNHIGPAKQGVAGVYNRALYLDERVRALQAWADFVFELKP